MEKDRYTPKDIKSFEQRSENKKGKRRNAIFADNGHTVSKDGAKRGAKGYDGGKKIKGRKRAIIVDTLGLIHAVHVCSANEHDTKLAVSLLEKIQGKFPRLRKILADRGFSCDNLRRFVTLKLNALLEIKDNKEE